MKSFICLSIIHIYFIASLFSQEAFMFQGKSVPPGSKTHFTIPISAQGKESFIPITVFHGKEEGPVLGITAGVHGYEYAPILAGQQLIHQIDPEKLTGTVILVQIANVGSFLGRSPYLNPLDGKNLNRNFPGNPSGTLTERIADFISQEVISTCDYFLDIHSGDAPEDLMPYCAYYEHDDFPEISQKGKEMATHMGYDHIVIFKTTGKDYMKKEHPSTYCSAQAFKIGIPAADIECGNLGQVEGDFVQKIVYAVEGLLKHLQMLPGESSIPPGIAFIEERSYLSSSHDGFFYPSKQAGDYVKKGMKLGYITDFFGKSIQEVYADKDGVLLIIIGTPPINSGETVAVIGVVE